MNKSEEAIQKVRRLRVLHAKCALVKGTRVLANNWFEGRIDGYTTDGRYIVKFDFPVDFPSIGRKICRACFEVGSIQEIK